VTPFPFTDPTVTVHRTEAELDAYARAHRIIECRAVRKRGKWYLWPMTRTAPPLKPETLSAIDYKGWRFRG
jgi:hypothetical protein